MHKGVFSILAAACLTAGAAHCILWQTFAIDSQAPGYYLSEEVEVMEEGTKTLSIEEVLSGVATDSFVPVTSYKVLNFAQPFVSGDIYKGSVIYIDNYKNIITNITKEDFYNYVQDKPFIISIRHNKIFKISKHYSEVDEGEALALFNDNDYLEIAVNKSSASGLLGLHYGQVVLVEHQLI